MEKTMIVVGAGMAGLSTGIYARRNGWRVTLFEAHSLPGGLCTAWERKGYTFDISMHMLTGSRSGPFHRMWRELGVLDGQAFHYHDAAMRVEDGERSLTVVPDPARLEADMRALSPADARLTREFVRLVTGPHPMDAFTLDPPEAVGAAERLRMMGAMLPFAGKFLRYRRRTVQEFAARFSDPFLREAVRFCVDSPGWPMPRFPMVAMTGFLRSGLTEAGVPLGGSMKVALGMAERLKAAGGEVRLDSRVEGLVVERDRVMGVRLADGSRHLADAVVWAADGRTAIFDLLGGRYQDDRVRRMYGSWTPVRPIVHVMLGVARDFSAEPHRVLLRQEKPIRVAGEEHRWVAFCHHCFDPSMAPPGKSAVEVWYDTLYQPWEELARDPDRYEAEKRRVAEETVAALDRRWPGFASQVEVVDVPTPVTYRRYTGNWLGSPDGWYITPENLGAPPLHSLPGLSAFHMVGQWTAPFTGTVGAALTGRQLVQLLCRREGKPFAAGPAA